MIAADAAWVAVAGLVLLAAVVFTLLPLFRRGRASSALADADSTLAQRLLLYRELLDVEFDHAMGKVGDDDLASFRNALLQRAAALLSRSEQESLAEVDAALEREIARVRQSVVGTSRSSADHTQEHGKQPV